MNENSMGSVMPVKNDATAPARRRLAALFLRLSLAALYIANAPATSPNIITGKKPVMYIPVTPLTAPSPPDQNSPRSLMPAVSNQKTAFSAW